MAINDDLKMAVLGSGTPLGNYPEISALYQPAQDLVQSNIGAASDAFNTNVQVENEKVARKAALDAEAQRLQDEAQRLADASDPSKYQQLPKEDGGYTFLDPSGKEISAYDYSRITGK